MNNPAGYPRSKDHPPSRDQLIMGIHALNELLKHTPDRIVKVFTSVKDAEKRKTGILSECEKERIPVTFTSEESLSRMCGSDSHQSFVAQVKARKFYTVKEFLKSVEEKDAVLVLLCDQIFDPQNFGALLRSAECFGVDGVGWSKNRGSDLTPTSAKTSCGASEWLPLIRVSNLAEGVSQFQEAGFEIVAAALKEGSKNALHFHFAAKTVLVVGSEGEGIQPLILKRADHIIHIPMFGKIQSLNVAQAATSLLTCIRKG